MILKKLDIKSILILMSFLIAHISYGQDSSQVQRNFLLDSKSAHVNTFYVSLSPLTSWSSTNGQSYNVMQLEGGFILNNSTPFR